MATASDPWGLADVRTRHASIHREDSSRRLRRAVGGKEHGGFRDVFGIDVHLKGRPLTIEFLQLIWADTVCPRPFLAPLRRPNARPFQHGIGTTQWRQERA